MYILLNKEYNMSLPVNNDLLNIEATVELISASLQTLSELLLKAEKDGLVGESIGNNITFMII